ncbi:MAG: divergent polysaccharide deacetylase family protein [Deltaproteobacteria bacterium]|nr:divergent polysaccharide deacetylase family protein [Candidatus Zymogenaceae bacterium]
MHKPSGRAHFIIFAILGVVVLCLCVAIVFQLSRDRVAWLPAAPTAPSTTDSPQDERTERIRSINDALDGVLIDRGLEDGLFSDRKTWPREERGLVWVEVRDEYGADSPVDVDSLRSALDDVLDEWEGVAHGEYEVFPEGGFILTVTAYSVPVRRLTVFPPAPEIPRVAIIMDDMGMSDRYIDDLLALDFPITCAVLPGESCSVEVATLAHDRGWEVMLHQPMEPIRYPEVNPGDHALFVSMDRAEIEACLESSIESVPFISGVNNHMGSLFTGDETGMNAVLDVLERHDLYFVDSRTTPRTVAYTIALGMGMPTAERNVFLDNDRDVKKIEKNIEMLLELAVGEGSAVAICHPYDETITALKRMEKRLTSGDVMVVPVGELILYRDTVQ